MIYKMNIFCALAWSFAAGLNSMSEDYAVCIVSLVMVGLHSTNAYLNYPKKSVVNT